MSNARWRLKIVAALAAPFDDENGAMGFFSGFYTALTVAAEHPEMALELLEQLNVKIESSGGEGHREQAQTSSEWLAQPDAAAAVRFSLHKIGLDAEVRVKGDDGKVELVGPIKSWAEEAPIA